MAVEKDFELLDDYLSNRLTESDKTAFEKKLEAEPDLMQEFKLQQDLTQGIRKARVAELKSMLNNVPVPPISNPASLLIKAGTWTIVSGLVISGVYFFYFSKNDHEQVPNEVITTTQPEVKETSSAVVEEQVNEVLPAAKEQPAETSKTVELTDDKSTIPTASEPSKPKVYDPSKDTEEPTADMKKYEQDQLEIISKAFVTSSIEVETEKANRKYSFHYVFKDGKLVLYGAFEKNLYEILEFISDDKRTVVLFYKTNYYLLDINKTNPTLLAPIKDQALLKKLNEYRGH